MGKIIVFLGPSLPQVEARSLLNALYLPPAAGADLISAVDNYQPDAIALIDGVFFGSSSVWHKEILYALSRGIAVYGASSMGAIRAAETDVFGMIGVGEIYRMYKSGELIDDDEVVLVYDSDYRPLSEPMINVRATLQQAHEEGIIDRAVYERILDIAKNIYFLDRTFAAIFHLCLQAGIDPFTVNNLRKFTENHYIDLKAQDARLLLTMLADEPIKNSRLCDFTPTHLYGALREAERKVRRRDAEISLRDIAEYTALHRADFEELNFHSLNRQLVGVLASLLGVEADSGGSEREKQRFCRKRGLDSEPALSGWLSDNDITLEEFMELMEEIAICRRLQYWFLQRQAYQGNVRGLLDQLRLENDYAFLADAVASGERLLQDARFDAEGTRSYPSHTPPQSLQTLIDEHLSQSECKIFTDLQTWLLETGFFNTVCLHDRLIKEQYIRRVNQNNS